MSFAMPLAQETIVNPATEKPAVTQTEQTESSKETESSMTTPSRGSDNFTIIKRVSELMVENEVFSLK